MTLKVLAPVLFSSLLLLHAQTPTGVERLKVEAQRGDANAQMWLGAAYEIGRGVGKDYAQALEWLSKSAKQGNADAQNLLGQMYENAEGVQQDYAQAARWYGAACEHRPDYGGAGQGCNNLGLLYLDGRGVEQNKREAYKYFKLSNSDSNLASVKSCMTPEEINDAEHRVQQWLEAHPEQ